MKRLIIIVFSLLLVTYAYHSEAQISRLDKRFNVNRAKPTQQTVAKPTPKAAQRTIARTPSKKQSSNRAVVKTSPTESKSGVVSVIKPKRLSSWMEVFDPEYEGNPVYSLEKGNRNEIKYRYSIDMMRAQRELLLVSDSIIVLNNVIATGLDREVYKDNHISFWDARTLSYISTWKESRLGTESWTRFRVLYDARKNQFFMTGYNRGKYAPAVNYCYAYDLTNNIMESMEVPRKPNDLRNGEIWEFKTTFKNSVFPKNLRFDDELQREFEEKIVYLDGSENVSNNTKCSISDLGNSEKLREIPELKDYAYTFRFRKDFHINQLDIETLSIKSDIQNQDAEPVSKETLDVSQLSFLPQNKAMKSERIGSDFWIIYPARNDSYTCNSFYTALSWGRDNEYQDIYLYDSNTSEYYRVPFCIKNAMDALALDKIVVGTSDCGLRTINVCSMKRQAGSWKGPRILSRNGELDIVFEGNKRKMTYGGVYDDKHDDPSKQIPVAYRVRTSPWKLKENFLEEGIGEEVGSLFSIWNRVPDSSQKSYWVAAQDMYCQLFLMDDDKKTGQLIHQWKGLWTRSSADKPIWMSEKRWMCLPIVENQWDIYVVSEDFASVQKLCSVYTGTGDAYAVILPNGKYAGTPGCESFLYKEEGDVRIGMSALAPWRNRPGEVLKAIGGNRDDIQALKETTKRWLTKLGFDPENMPAEPKLSEFPVAEVTMPALFSESDTVKFSVKLKATAHGIKKVEVRADGVLIPQSWDDELEIGEGEEKEVEVEVPLACGQNWIEVAAVDTAGISGDTFRFRTIYKGSKPSDLYVVTLGVSDYDQDDLKLQYAAKDAKDLAKAFDSAVSDDKHILTLTDKDVKDRRVLEKVKNFLADAEVDDRVVLYVAGHGMLDDKLNYYYAPAGFDSERIVETGIPMDELTACLHGTKARRRLLLLDTCHSGVLDEEGEEKLAMAGVQLPHGVRAIQHRGMKVKKVETPLNSNQKKRYIEDMFSRGSTERGINIIAGAAGAEFALESDAWNNGVFTASVIQAIRGESATDDRDVSVAELQRRVQRSVYKYTAGKQKPSVNASESADDYILADGVGVYYLKQIIENKEWNRIKEHLSRCPKIYAAGEAVEILELALKNHAPFDVIQQLFDHGWSLDNKYSLRLFLSSGDFYDNCKKDMVKMFLNKGSKLGEYDEYDGDDAELVAFLFEHGLKRYKNAFLHTHSKDLFRLSVKYGMNANNSMNLSDEIDDILGDKYKFLYDIHRQRIERKYRNDRYRLEKEMSNLYSNQRRCITPLWNLALQYVLNNRKEEAQREILEKMEILLEYGADPDISEEGADASDAAETTPLYLLCRHPDITFKEALPAIKLLLKYGARIHRTDCNGKEPLDEDDPYYRVLEKMAEAARAGKSLDEF